LGCTFGVQEQPMSNDKARKIRIFPINKEMQLKHLTLVVKNWVLASNNSEVQEIPAERL
jgi:hypothetical protein